MSNPEPATLVAQRIRRGTKAAVIDLASELEGELARLGAKRMPYDCSRNMTKDEREHYERGMVDGFVRAEAIVRAHLEWLGYVGANVVDIERKVKVPFDPAKVWQRIASNIRSARRIAYYYVLSWCSQPGGFSPRAAKHRGMLGRLGKLHLVRYAGGYAMLTDDGEALFRYLTKSRTSAEGRRLVKLGLAV